jgi:hypothetical protein
VNILALESAAQIPVQKEILVGTWVATGFGAQALEQFPSTANGQHLKDEPSPTRLVELIIANGRVPTETPSANPGLEYHMRLEF